VSPLAPTSGVELPARGVVETRRTSLAVVALLGVVAVVLAWNAAAYPWERSYDANASTLYVATLREEHRLPDEDDTPVWHNPPLFYAVAGVVQAAGDAVGLEPRLGVQLISAVAVAAVLVLVLLLARELFPGSPGTRLAVLAAAASTPVLLRAGALYHPEALATALTTAGLYALVRVLARGRPSVAAGVSCGLLLGLANLTRTWALAALGAALIALVVELAWKRERAVLRMAVALAVTAGVLLVPWLALKAAAHGNPLAYSRPVPSQWLPSGRPASFFVDPALDDVFTTPYASHYSNLLLPVVYTDWWGDYWRSWEIPEALHIVPPRLPDRYERPLVVQSLVGLLPSAAAVAGLVALAVLALRRRDAGLLALLLSVGLLAASFVGFLVRYPKVDGDNMKALYVLNAAPVVAIATGFAYAWIARRHVLLRLLTLGVVVVTLAATLVFVVLPAP
jgi:hypothetical protein